MPSAKPTADMRYPPCLKKTKSQNKKRRNNMLYMTNKHHTSSHIAATPMLRLWLLAMTVLFALNASAVLKEKNLDNTLSILR